MIDLFQDSEILPDLQRVSRNGVHLSPLWKRSILYGDKHHKNPYPKEEHICEEVEFMLPPKMATGFVLALGGALLCLVPGGQPAGMWMIGTGVTLALDGMVDGERPYYQDSDTGAVTPFRNPDYKIP